MSSSEKNISELLGALDAPRRSMCTKLLWWRTPLVSAVSESGKSFASSALRSRADDDGSRRSALLALHVAHPAAPPSARPPAAAAATSRAKRALAEVAGGGGGGSQGSGGGHHQGGHGRRVLPALRHQDHHALRRCAPKIRLSALKISNLRLHACSVTLCAGVCNLCNGGVRFVREHDPNTYILPAQFPHLVCYWLLDQQIA